MSKDFRTPEARKWADHFIPPETFEAIDAAQNHLEYLRDSNSQLRHVAHYALARAETADAEAGLQKVQITQLQASLTLAISERDEACEALDFADQNRTFQIGRAEKAESALTLALETLERIVAHFEGDQLHDEGAFDAECDECRELQAARDAISKLKGCPMPQPKGDA